MSRERIESAPPPRVPHAIISIRNVGSPRAKFGEGVQCKGGLRRAFDEVDDPRVGGIANQQARKVWAFAMKGRLEIQVLVCERGQGISRSAGVAAAISKIFTREDSAFFDHPRYRPNVLVHSRVLKAAAEDGFEF